MLAPSPDWFTGIKAVEMCMDGYWATTMTVTGVPYDAGVDGHGAGRGLRGTALL